MCDQVPGAKAKRRKLNGMTTAKGKTKREKTSITLSHPTLDPNPAHLRYYDGACDPEIAAECMEHIRNVPPSDWLDVGRKPRQLEKQQLLYGRERSDRRVQSPDIPVCFQALYRQAVLRIQQDRPDLFERIPKEAAVSCAVNQYVVKDPMKGSGKGLGMHCDSGAWEPLVIGVTLGDWRYLKFRHKQTKAWYRICTQPCSAYLFCDEFYTDWQHCSLPRSSKQDGTIYSISYRFK